MKKVVLSLLCIGILYAGQTFADSRPHQISGTLTHVPGNKLAISYINYAGGFAECIDTITLGDNGEFGFDVPFPSITPIMIEVLPFNETAEKKRLQPIEIFAVPGEQAVINGTWSDYTVTGSPFFNDFNEILQTIKPLITSNREAMSAAAIQYIKTHPDQEAAAILIVRIAPKDRLKAVGLLSEKAKTKRVIEFYQPILQEETEDNSKEKTVNIPEQSFPAMHVGDTAPDFTLKNLDNKDFTLSSLRGKYIVLDFWGSWCGWCIKGIPDMKEAYAKHKDKVEFIGIDCRDTPESWRKAVAKYKLPWIQVYNNGVPENVASKYNVEAYPSKYIINPEGKIIKIIVGEDPQFYTFLDELLK